MAEMYEIIIKDKFSAAHFLPNYAGDCAKMHGHTWEVEVKLRYSELIDGMAIDFRDAKNMLHDILPDHMNLNEFYDFNPTAENIAKEIYDRVLSYSDRVHSVTIWESDTAGVTYYVED